MSVYAFAGYGKPEKFTVNGEKVLACELDVMFTASNLTFDGRFSKGTPRPHKQEYFLNHKIHHWFIRHSLNGETVTELYEGSLPNNRAGYPFVWETEFDKHIKRVES